MRNMTIGLGMIFGAVLSASAAEARDVYCYATVMPAGDKLSRALTPPKLYVTEVFDSDEDVFLIAANFQATVPEAGLATCVTADDVDDIHADWGSFVGGSKVDGLVVDVMPPPTS